MWIKFQAIWSVTKDLFAVVGFGSSLITIWSVSYPEKGLNTLEGLRAILERRLPDPTVRITPGEIYRDGSGSGLTGMLVYHNASELADALDFSVELFVVDDDRVRRVYGEQISYLRASDSRWTVDFPAAELTSQIIAFCVSYADGRAELTRLKGERVGPPSSDMVTYKQDAVPLELKDTGCSENAVSQAFRDSTGPI